MIVKNPAEIHYYIVVEYFSFVANQFPLGDNKVNKLIHYTEWKVMFVV